MKFILFITILLLIVNCSKPKTVLICGDHICINKTEAEQYFEENLSIEVKIIGTNKKKDIDLVELNLSESQYGNRKIKISPKDKTENDLKILSSKEITDIKKDVCPYISCFYFSFIL